jgi:predicted AlkP superfamily pyrophosphatase or phosphodiesterase
VAVIQETEAATPLSFCITSPMMPLSLRAFLISVLCVIGLACDAQGIDSAAGLDVTPVGGDKSVVILISIDGFMPGYLDAIDTPHLDTFASEGIRAEALTTVFPTKTFPNHYTLVTGLYPAEHGIISNSIYDPEMDASFSLSNRNAVSDGRWWGGEPIWVTAEKQGVRAATMFWPGSEAEIGGVRPSYWLEYDGRIPNSDRVERVFGWLDLPAFERPRFITLYFSHVDSQGHRHGPESPQVADAIREADELIGQLMSGLRERGILDGVNILITSDHGMVETSSDRVIILDDYIDPDVLHITDMSPVLMAEPRAVSIEDAIEALRLAPNLTVYRRENLPEAWRFTDNARIPSVIAVADEGWSITRRSTFERNPERFNGGAHGYPPELQSMDAIFLARGPAFARGAVVEPFSNVHLYNVMTRILGIIPADNSGDDQLADRLLDFKALID